MSVPLLLWSIAEAFYHLLSTVGGRKLTRSRIRTKQDCTKMRLSCFSLHHSHARRGHAHADQSQPWMQCNQRVPESKTR
ncbi:hypothetical protein BJ170DRAFT_608474 [Xylariales sp. AK1849]|nr:hypothetical protein BJ170DRAFT_608474 [Xylariales sp. AK1849]